jgi:hypothetical protein
MNERHSQGRRCPALSLRHPPAARGTPRRLDAGGQPFPSSQQNNDKEFKITLRPVVSTWASISLIVFQSPTIVTIFRFRSRGCFNTVASSGSFSLAKTNYRVVLMPRVPT